MKKIFIISVVFGIFMLTSNFASAYYVDSDEDKSDAQCSARAVASGDFYYEIDEYTNGGMWIVYAEWNVCAFAAWGVYDLTFNYEDMGGGAFFWRKSGEGWYYVVSSSSCGRFNVASTCYDGTAVAELEVTR
ncbi:MAG: hypothetical protein KAQ75_09825 [Bacteroidales bacterium]|nr:hypothetical protein [Bacteroidales bacterium]